MIATTSRSKVTKVVVVECPRDAMQGWHRPIATTEKIAYINGLLKVGFDTIDFGSFVSPKAIPQMADTRQVLEGLETDSNTSGLLAIVANIRGAEEALSFDKITQLGFPFSISPTFQVRNTNRTIEESVATVDALQNLCLQHGKELVLYLSMAFGNPYGDLYAPELLLLWAEQMAKKGIRVISLADTVGLASSLEIGNAFSFLQQAHGEVIFGVHLHSSSRNWREKISAAYTAGCRRFDGSLLGVGGCPMANDDLVGNMATENILHFLSEKGEDLSINREALQQSITAAGKLFSS